MITLKNGATVPDLPAGLLSKEHPYLYIAQDGYYQTIDGKTKFYSYSNRYNLFAHPTPIMFAPASLGRDSMSRTDYNGADFYDTDNTDGILYNYNPQKNSDWVQETVFHSVKPSKVPDGYTMWSNHNIFFASGLDADGNLIPGTEVYFAKTEGSPEIEPEEPEVPEQPEEPDEPDVPGGGGNEGGDGGEDSGGSDDTVYEDEYKAPKSWWLSMGGHARRLSNTSNKFTPEQMDAFYSNFTGGGVEYPNVMEVSF
jgi:hypothetical protein